MSEEFYRQQRELLARVIAKNDVVITTAAVPGTEGALLITEDAVRAHAAGIGHCRSRGRTRRKLRTDAGG